MDYYVHKSEKDDSSTQQPSFGVQRILLTDDTKLLPKSGLCSDHGATHLYSVTQECRAAKTSPLVAPNTQHISSATQHGSLISSAIKTRTREFSPR